MKKTLSVYFNGTDDHNNIPEFGNITLAALLDHMTIKDHNNISIGVPGCGVETRDFRDLGAIFTFHLENQVKKIASQVEEMIKCSEDTLVLNVYGFSRGGAATFWLAQQLKHIPNDRLTLNIAAVEPVPGNFITGVYGDLLLGTNSTLSAAVADLSECKNIANVLVLLTNQPLPDIACHAPILPVLPKTCKIETDVTPGCHKSAVTFFKRQSLIRPGNDESAITFHRIVEFMQKCGTSFNFNDTKLQSNLVYSNSELENPSENLTLIKLYEKLTEKTSRQDAGLHRHMHLRNTIFTANENKLFLNRYHQQLFQVQYISDQNCMLTVKNRNPQRIGPQERKAIQFMQMAFVLAIAWTIYNKYFNEHRSECDDGLRRRF